MKFLYFAAYIAGAGLLIGSLTGGSLLRGTIDGLSEKTLEKAGFRKEYVESVDVRIDDLIYKSRQIELQIERIKNFFSSDKIDESKYTREQNNMMKKAVYEPFIRAVNYAYRILFGAAGVLFIFLGMIFQLVESSLSLRRRIRRLEEIAGISMR